ncbi:hypothetical protein F383_30022 [Gossypium arboreum]|uniref:Uncharacterized protein n=1 Tax=Gossypium arboreum TaxID=29729 RepID=A0A0B0N137_GOSAR|nr:hypothetical protein F383_30022 [Gossypium arboreum]
MYQQWSRFLPLALSL